jgi:hypothetical protein
LEIIQNEFETIAKGVESATTRITADSVTGGKQIDRLLDLRLNEQTAEAKYVSKKHGLVNRKAGYVESRWNQTGGERGIRTLDTLLEYARFPGVCLKPLGHLSNPLPNSALEQNIPTAFLHEPTTKASSFSVCVRIKLDSQGYARALPKTNSQCQLFGICGKMG